MYKVKLTEVIKKMELTNLSREEKKAYVLNWLAEHGITLDEDRIDALIEAAVYELNHGVLKEGAGNE